MTYGNDFLYTKRADKNLKIVKSGRDVACKPRIHKFRSTRKNLISQRSNY